jgi:D-3-phosphoglycerate dehydrogenase / 2-oxoglutarate reductase
MSRPDLAEKRQKTVEKNVPHGPLDLRWAAGSKLEHNMNTAPAKVAITDWTFSDLAIEEQILKPHGCMVNGRQCKSETDLIELVSDADAVITQFARVTPRVIQAMTKARVIVRYGIGVDNVDLEAARMRNIPVCNVPDYCMDEVADHTLAFILATTRQVVPNTVHLRAGQWGLAVPLTAMKTLRDLTVGVVGFGRIGREVVKRLLAFKCAVRVFDPAVPASEVEKLGAQALPFDGLLQVADILTLHCPSTPQTRRLMNRETFARLKPGAIFINIGRGDLVDTAALTAALESGRLAAAALDVFDPEPIPVNHLVLKMPNVILAPHIASASPAAVKKLRETAAQLAVQAVRGEPLANIVNGVKL